MGNVLERIEELEKKLAVPEPPQKKPRLKQIKIPMPIVRRVKKQGGAAVLLLRNNTQIVWTYGHINDGLIHVELNDTAYRYERIYHYNKVPVAVILEWRIISVGGSVEDVKFSQVGSDYDKQLAKDAGLFNYGQQTIIRAIKQNQVEDPNKKKSKQPWILYILVGAGVLYLVGTLFGGG